MATLTPSQIGAYLRGAGFPASAVPTGIAISLAESGGRTDALGHNTNGTVDAGFMQINSIHGYPLSCLYDPVCCAQAAFKVYGGSSGSWRPWATFTSGAYLSHMGAATMADPAATVAGGSSGAVATATPVNLLTGPSGSSVVSMAGAGLAKIFGGLAFIVLGLVLLGVDLPKWLTP